MEDLKGEIEKLKIQIDLLDKIFDDYSSKKKVSYCDSLKISINIQSQLGADIRLNDVLILEDDAIQVNDIPKIYPKDSITYIGGFVYNRKMMDSKPPEIQHQVGINLCPDNLRILGCLAYIVPKWEVALHILNRIYSENRYKAIDIMYGNIGIKQYYNYPASFREEGSISQISSKNKKNYIMTENFEYINYNKYAKSLQKEG